MVYKSDGILKQKHQTKTPMNGRWQGGKSQMWLPLETGRMGELFFFCHIFQVYNKPVLLL